MTYGQPTFGLCSSRAALYECRHPSPDLCPGTAFTRARISSRASATSGRPCSEFSGMHPEAQRWTLPLSTSWKPVEASARTMLTSWLRSCAAGGCRPGTHPATWARTVPAPPARVTPGWNPGCPGSGGADSTLPTTAIATNGMCGWQSGATMPMCPPVRGTFRGNASSTLTTEVSVTRESSEPTNP